MLTVLHTNPIEIAYAVMALVSLVLSVFSWRDATIDQAYQNASGIDGFAKMTADNSIRHEMFQIAISLIMILVSAASIILPPPPPDYTSLPQSAIMVLGWVLVAVIMSFSSIMDRSLRRQLRRVHDAPNPTDPTTGAPADDTQPADDDPTHPGSIGEKIEAARRRATDRKP